MGHCIVNVVGLITLQIIVWIICIVEWSMADYIAKYSMDHCIVKCSMSDYISKYSMDHCIAGWSMADYIAKYSMDHCSANAV